MFALGDQLEQLRPANTTAATLISTRELYVEITRLVISNTTGSVAAYRIHHDNNGTTYDQTTSLAYDVSIAANTTEIWEASAVGTGIQIAPDGTLGVRTDTANALTFTAYGATRDVAPRDGGF